MYRLILEIFRILIGENSLRYNSISLFNIHYNCINLLVLICQYIRTDQCNTSTSCHQENLAHTLFVYLFSFNNRYTQIYNIRCGSFVFHGDYSVIINVKIYIICELIHSFFFAVCLHICRISVNFDKKCNE